MPFVLEVLHEDGNLQYVPETSFADCFPEFGDSVQDDYLFQFGDLSEGLILQLRHHHAPPDGAGPRGGTGFGDASGAPDPRGPECLSHADARVVVISPEELVGVLEVRYNGRTVLARMGGDLVNVMRVSHLARLLLDSDAESVRSSIAGLYRVISARKQRDFCEFPPLGGPPDPESLDAMIAGEIGVTPAVLAEALAYDELSGGSPGWEFDGGDDEA